jgi:signal peptidase I
MSDAEAFTRRPFIGMSAAGILAPGYANARSVRSQRGNMDMAPTVLPNEIVELEHLDLATIQIGDILVYMHHMDGWDGLQPLMKRVVALPGQRIAFRDSVPVLDGIAAESEFLTTEELRYEAQGPIRELNLHRYRETLSGRSYDTYRPEPDPPYRDRDGRNATEVVVPDSYVFMVGDNRDRSVDSRWDGPIAIETVQRRAVSILVSPYSGREGSRLVYR